MGNKVGPFVGMVMAMLAQTSSMVISKAALSDGTNKFIMLLYSNSLAALFLLPLAFYHHRSNRPALTLSILGRFFLLAMFGCSGQIFGYVGIEYSSPTLGTAMLNLIPAFTFILAIIFRMERVDLRRASSQAKTLGTIVSISGAFVVTFYKGPPIITSLFSPLNPNFNINQIQFLFSSPTQTQWILGGFFLASDCLVSSFWYIVQASIERKYPAVILVVLYQLSFTVVIAALVCLIAVKDANSWKLKLDIGLLSILYTAIVSIGIRYCLLTWCSWKAGAFYCTMFKPLGIVFTVIMGALFLRETLYLGSLVGAIIIVTGFYGFMWGKAEEEKENVVNNLERFDPNTPLLQSRAQEKL